MTAYLTSTNDTLLTTARQLVDTAPTSSTTAASGQFAKNATGWTELYSQGGNASLAGAEPAPSGHGFIWDTTLLEGKAVLNGTWTPTVRLSALSAFTVDVYVRAFRLDSSGVYHQLTVGGTPTDILVASGVTLSTTLITYTASTPPTFDVTAFGPGDKLYVDVILHITTGSTANQANSRTISLGENSGAGDQVTMPALVPTIANGVSTGTSSAQMPLPVWMQLATAAGTSSNSAAFAAATPPINLTSIGATPLSVGSTMLGGTIGVQPAAFVPARANSTSSTSAAVTAATQIPSLATASSSTNTANIKVATTIPLAASSGTTSDGIGFTPTYVTTGAASSTSTDSLALTAVPTFRLTSDGTTSVSFTFAGPIAGVALVPLDIPHGTSTGALNMMSAPTTISMDSAASASSAIEEIWNGSIQLIATNSTSGDSICIGPFFIYGSAGSISTDFIVMGTRVPVSFSGLRATSTSSSYLAAGYVVVGPASIYELLPGISIDSLKGATTSYGPFGKTFDVYDYLKRGVFFYPTGKTLTAIGATRLTMGTTVLGGTTGVAPSGKPVEGTGQPTITVAKYSHQDYGLMSFPTLLQKIQ